MRQIWFTAGLLLLVCACADDPAPVNDNVEEPGFVGSNQCAECHQSEYDEWQGSHHQMAMQEATVDTVLGDFDDATFDYAGATTTFSRHDEQYTVETENAAGSNQQFEVTHTFGITPLQQYLVEYPGGRKQALPFAWDTRAQDEGGQRWYHLYPDDAVSISDPLHWTGPYFNWNFMCAECHSTNVRAGYDIGTDSFHTVFDEISVGCEACHGPGSVHVAQATQDDFDATWGLPVDLDDRNGAAWVMNAENGIAVRTPAAAIAQQPESCGRCHSRRSVIMEEYAYGRPLTDTHGVSLLQEDLYHADGRIQDEVYVYGSFVQSKMYAAGVTCTDCHNPHTGALHAGPDPNDTCKQCHLPAKFASTDHAGPASERCVECHMPATTYMGVDDRRDHSFRLPDTASDPDHYGAVIGAARAGSANEVLLAALTDKSFPAIARATMLTLLEPVESAVDAAVLAAQVNDPSPLVRIAALQAMRGQAPELRVRAGSHLLRDPVRGVRAEAAITYAEYRDILPLEDARAFAAAANEYRDSMRANASRAEAALGLAEFESTLNNTAAAAEMYRHAVRVGPLYALAHHAYGLSLVREGKSASALASLRKAVELGPEVSRFIYVYGVALNSLGQSDEAVKLLAAAREKFALDYDIAWSLATIHRDRGEREAALSIARDIEALYPGNRQARNLIESLAE